MKTIKVIREWWHKVLEHSNEVRKEKRMKALVKESAELLQAMEFQGEIYICYHGIPLMTEDALTCTIADTLEQSRGIYVEYMNLKQA